MIPANTFAVIGGRRILSDAFRHDPHTDYAMTGIDLNDLRVLALRFNFSTEFSSEEKRDWQNRLNLMCDNAVEAT